MKTLLLGSLKCVEWLYVLMVVTCSLIFLIAGIYAMATTAHGIFSRWVWGVPRWPMLTAYAINVVIAVMYILWLCALVYDLYASIRRKPQRASCICGCNGNHN